MNRITKKEIESYDEFVISLGYEYCFGEADDAMYRKLKSLEDIEEELGIDLITLFKALKDGINVYYEDEERYKFHNDLRIEYHKTLGWGLVYIYGSCCRNDMPMMLDMEFYELKGYGKTWALTKEELENGK